MQKDRKRCERRNKNLCTYVHQHAATAQGIEAVAPVNSDSAARGQPPVPPAAVRNDVTNGPASDCYAFHYHGEVEQERH